MDTLTVSGVGRHLDGAYDCDVVSLIDVSSPDALTVREAEEVKSLSGARGNEIAASFIAGDMACRMALAVIILRRHGKDVDPSDLWDKPIGAMRFDLGPVVAEDADPPTVGGETPSRNGGESGRQTSDAQVEEPSLTGALG